MTKSWNAGSELVELCWISSHFFAFSCRPNVLPSSDLYDVSGYVVPRSTEGNVVHVALSEIGLHLAEERVNGVAAEEVSSLLRPFFLHNAMVVELQYRWLAVRQVAEFVNGWNTISDSLEHCVMV